MPRPVEPRPLKQRQVSTVFLRCPSYLWPQVSSGAVGEFRAAAGGVPQAWKVPIPTLAVVYRRQLSKTAYDYRLMMLAGVRREHLGAITEEGLAAAGYEGEDAYVRFRRDLIIAEKRRYNPQRMVFVFTVRPICEGDREAAGLAVLQRLYGEFEDDRSHTLQMPRLALVGGGRR
jgi:hypothetical protein